MLIINGKVGPAHLKIASSPSYTLKEIEALAREFLREKEINADDSITALALSRFAIWLARREREGRDDRNAM